jgi:hypothetical protein
MQNDLIVSATVVVNVSAKDVQLMYLHRELPIMPSEGAETGKLLIFATTKQNHKLNRYE